MNDSEQRKSWYGDYTLEQRKSWYGEVADAYNRVRPRYPKELICRAVELAQLCADAVILEVGCGPGTATISFARLGFSMLCLEPSLLPASTTELCPVSKCRDYKYHL